MSGDTSRARKRADKVLASNQIGLVAEPRVEALREALQAGDRNRIVEACNMIDTALWLLREVY